MRRQPGWALWAALLKKSSKSRDSRFWVFWYAEVMSPRKTDLIMQPPRHIWAMPA